MSELNRARINVRIRADILYRDQTVKYPDFQGITGGHITRSASTRMRSSGSIEMINTGQDIDWLNDRLFLAYCYTVGGVDRELPLGVLTLANPTEDNFEDFEGEGKGDRLTVTASSPLQTLDMDAFETTFSVPQGANALATAVGIIQDAGEFAISATPSNKTLSGMLVWDPGTSKLTIVNELLAAINYWGLSVNRQGSLVLAPYVDPGSRNTVFEFRSGLDSIRTPNRTRSVDMSAVCNKVILVAQPEYSGGDLAPALVGVATNMDPKSPVSRPSLGRFIAYTKTGVEATDQATLNDLAMRELKSRSAPTVELQVEHVPVDLDANDVVYWTSETDDNIRCVVQDTTQSLEFPFLVTTNIAGVPFE